MKWLPIIYFWEKSSEIEQNNPGVTGGIFSEFVSLLPTVLPVIILFIVLRFLMRKIFESKTYEELNEKFEQKISEKSPKGETDLGFMTIKWKERDGDK